MTAKLSGIESAWSGFMDLLPTYCQQFPIERSRTGDPGVKSLLNMATKVAPEADLIVMKHSCLGTRMVLFICHSWEQCECLMVLSISCVLISGENIKQNASKAAGRSLDCCFMEYRTSTWVPDFSDPSCCVGWPRKTELSSSACYASAIPECYIYWADKFTKEHGTANCGKQQKGAVQRK